MDLVQIRYFVALASTLNFTRAAELCNVTQPALTKSIQRLEDELGGALLLRERASTRLTALGTEMLPMLEQIHAAAMRAKQYAAELKSQVASPLRVGFSLDAPLPPFAPVFAALAAHFAVFKLTVTQASRAGLIEGLRDGTFDAGVMTEDATPLDRMHSWPLFKDLAILLVPMAHSLAGLDPIPAGAVTKVALVCSAQGDRTTVYDRPSSPFAPAQHQAGTAAQAADLVRAGLGVTWSTELAGPVEGLTRRRVDWRDRHDVVLVAAAGRPMTRAVDAFIKLVRARAWQGADATRA
jgi:LysR family hydrogen peroxide-inducible transcriptional activator